MASITQVAFLQTPMYSELYSKRASLIYIFSYIFFIL